MPAFRRTRSTGGYTLVEFIMGTALGLLVVLCTGALYVQSSKSFLTQLNLVDLDDQSRSALDRITQQIRMANSLASFSATNLVFVDFDTNTLAFAYDAATKRLTRTKNGVSTTLLTGCDSAQFSVFQRTPNGGDGDFYATTNAAECKLVQMTWTCSRNVLGIRANSQVMQTAKVMMRNKP